jgi:hypothetical protein
VVGALAEVEWGQEVIMGLTGKVDEVVDEIVRESGEGYGVGKRGVGGIRDGRELRNREVEGIGR